MPTLSLTYRDDSERRAAWTAHYIVKGCHPVKAEKVAWNKCQRSTSWPPSAKPLR